MARTLVRLQIISLSPLFLAFDGSAWAQKDTGSIVGTVKDSSGALIPDAKITVTETEKGTTFVTSSDASGEYVASPLNVGHYKVTVEKQGFKIAVAGPIELDVQQRAAVNVTLQVGEMVIRSDAEYPNHPNLQFAKSGPQNSISTTTFGTPQFGFLTAARSPRQIQFALKFYY